MTPTSQALEPPAIPARFTALTVIHGGSATLIHGRDAQRVLGLIAQGAAVEWPMQSQLETAVELYRAHFFEHSARAQLLTLVTIFETLAPVTYKRAKAQGLIDEWHAEINDLLAGLEAEAEGRDSLEALDRELLRRSEESKGVRVRQLVRDAARNRPDCEEFVRRTSRCYGVRSNIVHAGPVTDDEVVQALADAKEIAAFVLKVHLTRTNEPGT